MTLSGPDHIADIDINTLKLLRRVGKEGSVAGVKVKVKVKGFEAGGVVGSAGVSSGLRETRRVRSGVNNSSVQCFYFKCNLDSSIFYRIKAITVSALQDTIPTHVETSVGFKHAAI